MAMTEVDALMGSGRLPKPRFRLPLSAMFLAGLVFIILFPLGMIAFVSFVDRNEILDGGLFSRTYTIGAYIDAWVSVPFPRYFVNSLIVTVSVTIGSTFTSILAAYVFARAEFVGRNFLFLLVIGTLMIPAHITLIPNYLTFARFHALDSFAALILPFLASGFSIFFLRQYMMGIPKALDEVARIDGASHWKILWTIIVPLSWPAITVVMLFSFMNEWNNFIWPLLSTTSEDMRTVQIGLRYLYRDEAESGAVNWPLVMAGTMITLAPLLIIFIIAERHLIKGITMGSFR